MASSSDLKDRGLKVTVTPSQSAFFAGELFTATITFSNPAPSSNETSLHTLHSVSDLPLRSSDHLKQDSNWAQNDGSLSAGNRNIGSISAGANQGEGNPFYQQLNESKVTSSIDLYSGEDYDSLLGMVGEGSGNAIETPLSAAFNLSQNPIPRSVSGRLPSATIASSSKPTLPTRRGLIGKPLPIAVAPPTLSNHSRRVSSAGNGIYNTPRKPSAGQLHTRSQSMAVSSPNLLERELSFVKNVGKSNLGRRESTLPLEPSPEESPPPTLINLPSSTSSGISSPLSTPSTSNISLSQAGMNQSPQSKQAHPYLASLSRQEANFQSTDSLAESEEYDPANPDSPGRTFYKSGKNETMDDLTRAGMEGWSRRAGLGINNEDEESKYLLQPSFIDPFQARRNSFLHPNGTLSLLWSFAHLEGTFEVDPTLIKPTEFTEVKKALIGGFGSGFGGGTLENDVEKTGWKNWIFGGSTTEDGKSKLGGGATLQERAASTMKERTIPTFSSPPSILGVDVILEPGQSKIYKFSIRIPADLPPSFRGKAIKFSYQLVVGTNRSAIGPRPSAIAPPREALSRIMRVPVRVYNHVAVTGARPFYDLTNPIVYHRDEATIEGADDAKVVVKTRRPSTGLQDFEDYATALLNSVIATSPTFGTFPNSISGDGRRRSSTIMEAPPAERPEMRTRTRTGSAIAVGNESIVKEENEDVPDEGDGCKAAVEIVSRNSKKVSYDINKDGYMVATLTLVKSAYRLGETVNGSVVINGGDGRVLRVSARLETHEHIETSIATKTAPQLRQITRRLHAEHHETTLDSARIGFALAIPSGATPDFATSGVKLQWSVKLSFLVIPPSPDTPLDYLPPKEQTSRFPFGRAPKPIPVSVPKSLNNHGRSKSFSYGFEPAVPVTLPAAPLILPTGATHLMPILPNSNPSYFSYRAVPDLGFVPILFSSGQPIAPATPGPLQRSAVAGMHKTTPSFSSMTKPPSAGVRDSVVLVPAKYETVECSIPIKVYPGNTPFRPTITVFEA